MYPLTIGLDFDDSYTADPELWNAFIENAVERGHKVVIVTWRYNWQRESMETLPPYVVVYFTGMKAKRKYMLGQGVHIDIWIDDNPLAILEDC